MRLKLIFVAFASVLALAACSQSRCMHHIHGKKVCGNSQLYQFHDGRYGMWAPDDYWYWYMITQTNNGQTVNQYYYATGAFNVPTGGTWVRSNAPSQVTFDEVAGTSPMQLNSANNQFTFSQPSVEDEGASFSSGAPADEGVSLSSGAPSSITNEGSSFSSGSSSSSEGSSFSSGSSESSGGGESASSGGDSGGGDGGGGGPD